MPAYLLSTNSVTKAIGIDRIEHSLRVASRNATRCGVIFDLRLGSGLSPLNPGEVEVVVLAGLGSQTIVEVLSDAPCVVQASSLLVLQPMRDTPQLRKWARTSNLKCVSEDLVVEAHRMYSVLTYSGTEFFTPTQWVPSEVESIFEVTDPLLANPKHLLVPYLTRRAQIRNKIAQLVEEVQPGAAQFHRAVVSSIIQTINSL